MTPMTGSYCSGAWLPRWLFGPQLQDLSTAVLMPLCSLAARLRPDAIARRRHPGPPARTVQRGEGAWGRNCRHARGSATSGLPATASLISHVAKARQWRASRSGTGGDRRVARELGRHGVSCWRVPPRWRPGQAAGSRSQGLGERDTMRQTALPDESLDRRARPEQPAWNAADQAAARSEPSQLVARASSGDRAAWDELVDRYGALVWATARRYGLSPRDAAEVSQVVWLRLVQHLGALRQPERVGAWLATTARREALRLRQVRGREV